MKHTAQIGVFGGSGFYSFLEDVEEVTVETPYGAPSDKVTIGTIGEKRVAFLPRHGRNHDLPPHMINYRANVYAMKSLGVERIIGPTAAGSLNKNIKPGHFVITDQLVDFTSGRKDTFFDGPITRHLAFSDPYCPETRELGVTIGKKLDLPIHDGGTMVVVQGPRFSTRAELEYFMNLGWDTIGMTQYPEVPLARELGLCYTNISLITDSAAEENAEEVTHEEVLKVFNSNMEHLKKLLYEVILAIPQEKTCNCHKAIE